MYIYLKDIDYFAVTRAGNFRQSGGWEHEGRKNNINNFVLITGGSAVFSFFGNDYKVIKGSALIIPENVYYKATTENFCEYCFVHFKCRQKFEYEEKMCNSIEYNDDGFDVPATKRFFESHTVTDLREMYGTVEKIMTKIATQMISKNSNTKLDVSSYFSTVMSVLHQKALKEIGEENFPSNLARIVNYIKMRYTENITLSRLSEEFLISKQHILRLFKNNLNMTVSVYVNKIKLEHSLELLKYSNLNVSEISEHLGFSSPYYFCRVFKKYYGVSPKNFNYKEE